MIFLNEKFINLKKGKLVSVTLGELAKHLNTKLDISNFDESINGIQIANSGPTDTIATAVSCSLQAVQRAVEMKSQALIVHHGIFWKGDDHQITDIKYQKIKLLIENDIALLCYHIPLDAHQELGNNWKAAKDLGMQDLQSWFNYNGSLIGVIGSTDQISFDDLTQKVETYYNNKANAVKTKDQIKFIGILSGGAYKFMKEAVKAPVDCFITGTVDEPVWDMAHEKQISFLGMGHYATEKVGVKALGEYLQKEFQVSSNFIYTGNPF